MRAGTGEGDDGSRPSSGWGAFERDGGGYGAGGAGGPYGAGLGGGGGGGGGASGGAGGGAGAGSGNDKVLPVLPNRPGSGFGRPLPGTHPSTAQHGSAQGTNLSSGAAGASGMGMGGQGSGPHQQPISQQQSGHKSRHSLAGGFGKFVRGSSSGGGASKDKDKNAGGAAGKK